MPNLYIPKKGKVKNILDQSTSDSYITKTLVIEPDEEILFQPGQFVMISLRGFGESAMFISGNPSCSDIIEVTIREVGNLTHHLVRSFKVGDKIEIRGPFGTPWPLIEGLGRDLVIVSGGTGLNSLRPVILHALENREDYEKIKIFISAHRPDELIFTEEYREWVAHPDIGVYVTVDRLPYGTIPVGSSFKYAVGDIRELLESVSLNPDNSLILVSAPETMTRGICNRLVSNGFSQESIYISLQRRMKCGMGKCGHCQLGSTLVCKDGPIFRYDIARTLPDTLL